MSQRRLYSTLIGGLLLAGCGAQPLTSALATSDPLSLGDAMSARYQTLAVNLPPVAIQQCTPSSSLTAVASSDRNPAWFAVSNLTDGNLHSAWGPAASDASPSLTLSLAQATQLSGLGIKMDAGATFDVAVNDGATWTSVATNVTPTYGALDLVSLTSTLTAHQVKLSFHGQDLAKLLVCEVKLFGCGPSAPPAEGCFRLDGGGEEDRIGEGNHLTYDNRFLISAVASGQQASGQFFIGKLPDTYPLASENFDVTSFVRTGNALTLKGTSVDGALKATLDVQVLGQSGASFRAQVTAFHVTNAVSGAAILEQAFPVGQTASLFELTGTTDDCPAPAPTPVSSGCLGSLTGMGVPEVGTRGLKVYSFNHVGLGPNGPTGTFVTDGSSFEANEYRVTSIVAAGDTITLTGTPLAMLDRLSEPTSGVGGTTQVTVTVKVSSREGNSFKAYVSRDVEETTQGTDAASFDPIPAPGEDVTNNVGLEGTSCVEDR